MRAIFTIDVEFNSVALELEAKRCGFPSVERALEAVLTDCECRLHDAVRHRNGVERVGSTVHRLNSPELTRAGGRP
jgi:hypothetical protein